MEQNLLATIPQVCRRLYEQGWLANCDGNVSQKISCGGILITPSGRPKYQVTRDELIRIPLEKTAKKNGASSELPMHLSVYLNQPNACAVVHAHPPYSTAWGIQGLKELPLEYMSESILAVGSVPIAPYARPGSKKMGDVIRELIQETKVIILAHHGMICWGESLQEAYFGIERVEHIAKTLYLAKNLGHWKTLPQKELDELKQMRKTFNGKIL